jgi:hypothetical protein
MTTSRSVRTAGVVDAAVVADLLDRFNREYEAPTPGPALLVARLERLLSKGNVVAVLAGEPAVGLAERASRQAIRPREAKGETLDVTHPSDATEDFTTLTCDREFRKRARHLGKRRRTTAENRARVA